jgi:hypothetical protein
MSLLDLDEFFEMAAVPLARSNYGFWNLLYEIRRSSIINGQQLTDSRPF